MEGEGRALWSSLRLSIIELAYSEERAVKHSVAAFLEENGSSLISQRTSIVTRISIASGISQNWLVKSGI
jgi:hypothetical protein